MIHHRPILAVLHRNGTVIWTHHYARFETAARRATELAICDGEPGDVVEFAHAVYGNQIGTLHLRVGGKLDMEWSESTLRIRQLLAKYQTEASHGPA